MNNFNEILAEVRAIKKRSLLDSDLGIGLGIGLFVGIAGMMLAQRRY